MKEKRKDFLQSLFLASLISRKPFDLERGEMAEWTKAEFMRASMKRFHTFKGHGDNVYSRVHGRLGTSRVVR
jgi:hypothetical protein